MKKELYAIFLAMMLLMQSVCCVAWAEEPEDKEYDHLNKEVTTFIKGNLLPPSEASVGAEQQSNYDYAYEKLFALGILNGSGNQSISTDAPLTRIEFLNIIMSCMGVSNNGSSETGFSDVPAAHEFSGMINIARSYGIVVGSDGFFRPDDSVTYIEAIVMAVRAFGRELEAKQTGGFETGYVSAAIKYDLLDGIGNIDYFSVADKKKLYRIVLNLVESEELAVLDVNKDGVYYVQPDYKTTMLEKYWDYRYSEGVVTSVGLSGLYSDTNDNPDIVVINNIELIGEYSECIGLLGMYSKVWYDPETTEIIYMEALEKKNSVLTIDVNDAIGLSNGKYRYFDGQKEKSVSVISNPYVIYNGRLATSDIENLYTPEQGTVTLINNAGGSSYNVIIIENYTDMVVGTVNTNEMIVYDAYSSEITNLDNSLMAASGKTSGIQKSIELNSDKATGEISIVNDTNKEIYFGMISKNDVMTIKKSADSKLVYVYVSSNTVKGKITEQYEKDGKRYILVDGKEYKLTQRCEKLCENAIQFNVDVTLRINKFGNVVAVDAADGAADGMQYAYVIRTFIEEMAADGPLMYLRLLKADGKISNIPLAEKCRIDGAVKKEADKQEDAFELGVKDDNSRVIKYELNEEGCIVAIDTEYCDPESETKESTLKALKKISGEKVYYKSMGSFEEQFWIDTDNVIVFAVNNSEVAEDKKYRVMNSSIFDSGEYYDVNAYTSEDSYEAEAVMTVTSAQSSVASEVLAIVSRIGVIMHDGETMYEFSAYINGAETKVKCDAEEFESAGVAVGDIIRYDSYEGVVLGAVEKVYDGKTQKFPENENSLTNGTHNEESTWCDQAFLVRKGFVYDIKGEYFSFVLTDDIDEMATFDPQSNLSDMVVTKMNSNVSIYKMTDRGLTVTTGSVKDLKPYTDCGNECNAVIFRSYWMQPKQFIIIERG